MHVEEDCEQLGEAARVLDDRFGSGLGGRGIALAGGKSAKEDLGVTFDQREGRPHVVPGHGEDVFP